MKRETFIKAVSIFLAAIIILSSATVLFQIFI